MTKKQKITTFTLALALSVALFSFTSCKNGVKEKRTYTVIGNAYEMKCSYANRDKCGVTLADCEDGRRYECLQNVMIENGQ